MPSENHLFLMHGFMEEQSPTTKTNQGRQIQITCMFVVKRDNDNFEVPNEFLNPHGD
jgi:hypothetical protein